jgi:DNA polymerase III subunit beta
MELRVETKSIVNELNHAVSIVETKGTIPILAHLLLKAQDGYLEIDATDLEVTFRTRIPAVVAAPGGITVDAKSFAQLVRGFSGTKELVLKTTDDRKLFVQPFGEKPEYFFSTLPEEDYPRLLEAAGDGSFFLPISMFRKILSEALTSAGSDESRFSIRGALLMIDKKSLSMVSTDAHRLTFTKRNLDIEIENPLRVLVPRKTLQEAQKIDGNEDIKILIKDNHIFFESGTRILYSRLMDANFPAYEKVIPKDSNKTVMVKRLELLEKLRRISFFSDVKTRAVNFEFKKDGVVHIDTRNEKGDTGIEFFNCDSYEGEEVKITFNGQYLIDFLSAIEDEAVSIKLKDFDCQCLIEPVRDKTEGECMNVLMPLRVD